MNMNKRNFMFLALLGAMVLNGHGEVRAQDASRWHNVDVNQQNRAPVSYTHLTLPTT